MATLITKNSSTASAVPAAGDLVKGELAVNVTDKKVYTKDNSAAVVKLVGSLGNQEANAVAITGGTINGTTIGATTPSTGAFTTASASSGFTGNLTGNVTGNVSGTAANVTGVVAIANGGTGLSALGTGVQSALGQAVTGSGSFVLSTSPSLTTPNLGTPSAAVLTNATGLPLTTGVTGTLGVANGGTGITAFGTGVATALGQNVTGSGGIVLATSPSLTTPNLGTPSAATLTNATGLPISTGVSGLGTGVATALAVATGSAGAFVVNGGALGTPSAVTLTNATGLPLSTGVTGTLATTNGGTGLTSFTANRVFYASSTSAIGQSANLTFDGTTLTAANFTDSSLTSGRVTYATTGGNLTDSANLTFDGTNLGVGVTPTANQGRIQANGAGQSWFKFYDSSAGWNFGTFYKANGTTALAYLGSGGGNAIAGATVDDFVVRAEGNLVFTAGGGTEAMRLTSTGLGIGTSSNRNSTKLDVRGNISFGSNASYYGQIGYDAGVGTLDITSGDGGFRFIRQSGSVTSATLDSSGNLGLGVTPSAWASGSAIDIAGWASFAQRNTNGWTLVGGNVYWDGSTYRYKNSSTAALYELRGPTGVHAWHTAPSGTAGNAISFTQAMTLDASGNLGVGTTSPINNGGYGGFSLNGTSGALLSLITNGTESSRIASISNETSIQCKATTGYITFVQGVSGGTERARITSGGNLLVGTTTDPAYSGYTTLALNSNTNGGLLDIQLSGSRIGSLQAGSSTELRLYAAASVATTLYGGGTERARITSGGDLLVGTTDSGSGATAAKQRIIGANSNNLYLGCTSAGGWRITSDALDDAGTFYHIKFAENGTQRGSITSNGSSTTYATSSDYRLKDNPQPLTGSGAFIDALKPKTWNWKTDGSKGVGFIAHEVQEVSPGSVVGTKDAVDEEGKPIMQAMEYGSAEFIANIIAELQSLRARVAQLETK